MNEKDRPPQEFIDELARTDLKFREIERLYDEDVAIRVGIVRDPDAFEVDAEWFAGAMTSDELYAIHPELKPQPASRSTRGPQKAPKKEAIHIRLDADVVAFFRDLGPGWQTKLNHILRSVVFPENDDAQ